MMENSRIANIGVENLYQHPDNPRKDLGDLSELSESIKKNGIMQNLTVIPGHWDDKGEWHEDGYTLIIGHRRFAAGKLAGVTEFPCRVVTDMDQKDQVGTMLEENMQRNDLTIWEQANGFQTMLDLGDTEEQIAEKTGFSKTTVKRRLNIAKLDQKVLKEKEDQEAFQLSLTDLYELEKIKDVKTRNKILREATDSRNLAWRAKQAVLEETKQEHLKIFKELFKKEGIKQAPKEVENERYYGKWVVLQEWDVEKDPPKKLKKFTEENIQWVAWWNAVAVIVPAKKEKRQLSEYEIREKERQKAKKAIKLKSKEMYSKMDVFIRGIIDGDIKALKEDVELYKDLISTLMQANLSFYRSDLVNFYAGKGLYELEHDEPEKYEKFVKWEESLTPLHKAIAFMSCVKKIELFNYNAEYHEESAKRVKTIVDFLGKYGFSVSVDEEQLLNGMHELYVKK